jgi:hypothetical protein
MIGVSLVLLPHLLHGGLHLRGREVGLAHVYTLTEQDCVVAVVVVMVTVVRFGFEIQMLEATAAHLPPAPRAAAWQRRPTRRTRDLHRGVRRGRRRCSV